MESGKGQPAEGQLTFSWFIWDQTPKHSNTRAFELTHTLEAYRVWVKTPININRPLGKAAFNISLLHAVVQFSGVLGFKSFGCHLDVGDNPLYTPATSNLKIFLNPLWDRTFVL